MDREQRFLRKLLQDNKDRPNSRTPLSTEGRPHNLLSLENTTREALIQQNSITRTQEKGKTLINSSLLRRLDQLSQAYHKETDAFRKGVLLYHLDQLEHEIERYRWGGIP